MSEMFKIAHTGAKADRVFDPYYSYAYYFRLHLISLQYEAMVKRTGMARGFQVIEPRRVWA